MTFDAVLDDTAVFLTSSCRGHSDGWGNSRGNHVHQGMSNTGQPSKLVQFALWFGWDGKIRKGVLVILNLELPWVIHVRSPCPSLSCCFGVTIFSHPQPSSAVPSWVLSPGMTCRSIPETTKPTPAAFRAWKICQLLPLT